MEIDYINSFESVKLCVKNNENDIVMFINKLFNLCDNIIQKLLENNKYDIIEKYYLTISNGIGKYAGSMSSIEFDRLCNLSKNNLLTLKHCRKCFNAIWAICKICLSNIFLEPYQKLNENIKFDVIKNNIDIGLNNLLNYFPNSNIELIKNIFENGIKNTFSKYDNIHETNESLFYTHIIRMSHLEGRQKSFLIKGQNKSNIQFNNFDEYISNLLSDEEQKQILPNNIFPWTDSQICGISEGYFFDFCIDNNVAFISGISGTTFELMLYIISFLNLTNENDYKTTMLFFLHFHTTRKSHAVIEIIMAFYEINKYLIDNLSIYYMDEFISVVVNSNILLYSSEISEELINKTNINNSKVLFDLEKH